MDDTLALINECSASPYPPPTCSTSQLCVFHNLAVLSADVVTSHWESGLNTHFKRYRLCTLVREWRGIQSCQQTPHSCSQSVSQSVSYRDWCLPACLGAPDLGPIGLPYIEVGLVVTGHHIRGIGRLAQSPQQR